MPHEDLAQDHGRPIGLPLNVQLHEGRSTRVVLIHDLKAIQISKKKRAPSHVSLLAHLQGEGLVVRTAQHILDGRITLHITSKGSQEAPNAFEMVTKALQGASGKCRMISTNISEGAVKYVVPLSTSTYLALSSSETWASHITIYHILSIYIYITYTSLHRYMFDARWPLWTSH